MNSSIRNCTVTRLRSRFRHCVHAYHGVDPWSPDGSHIVYLGFDEPGRGVIVVRDIASDEETVVAETTDGDWHTAASQRWVMSGKAVVFRSKSAQGAPCPAIAWLDRPGKATILEPFAGGRIRHICADGEHAFATSDRADTGRAVLRFNLRTRQSECLLTAEEGASVLPPALYDSNAQYCFTHPVPNLIEDRFFVKLMRITDSGNNRFCAFLVMDLQTREVRCFGDRISGHPFWMQDNLHILNIKSPRDGSDNRHLVLVNSNTGEDHRLVDLPLEGPGHPSQSPNGRWIATDAFTADGQASPIYVVDLTNGAAKEIARLPHRFKNNANYDPSQITRGHPHPVWSRNSRQLLVNCNNGGDRMELMLLSDFIAS